MSDLLQLYRQAHVAPLAVEEPVPPPNAADATAITVVLPLVVIVEQVAYQTCVLWEYG